MVDCWAVFSNSDLRWTWSWMVIFSMRLILRQLSSLIETVDCLIGDQTATRVTVWTLILPSQKKYPSILQHSWTLIQRFVLTGKLETTAMDKNGNFSNFFVWNPNCWFDRISDELFNTIHVKIAVIIRPFGDESPHRNTIIPDLIWLKLRETSSRIDGGFKGQNYLEMLRGLSQKGETIRNQKKATKTGVNPAILW